MRYFNISDEPVIYPIKDISPKAFNDVGCDLRRKGITFPKRIVPNTCYRIWNVDAFEGNTTIVFTTDYYSIFYR